jgi:hypothetical protein
LRQLSTTNRVVDLTAACSLHITLPGVAEERPPQ